MGTVPRYSREEVARRGDEIYERAVLPRLGPADEGKFALIDVETGDHEVDRDEIAASDRLLARNPEAAGRLPVRPPLWTTLQDDRSLKAHDLRLGQRLPRSRRARGGSARRF